MLEYLKQTNTDDCLACIGFFGIVAGAERIKTLLMETPSIKNVAVDTLGVSNRVFVVDAKSLMLDSELFIKFD